MHEGLPKAGDVVAEKYVVEEELGRGGMGAVYSVAHRVTGKRLAVKCLLPSHASNPVVVERFLREARAAGRIQHRHVIDVFDVGRDGSLLYLVMPLLQGKSLGDLLADERITVDEMLRVLVRAMDGVAAAHAVRILHRDLKPGNIFVCVGPSGKLDDPRVLDFGISKLDYELSSSLTRSGATVGTPYYMALEQLTGQRDVDERVDVYAMGVILYEAIVGQPPHTAENVAALALRLMHTPPRHVSLARPDLPDGLAKVIMRALARDRDERYRDMRELIEALTPFIALSASLQTSELESVPLRTPREAHGQPLDPALARASSPTELQNVYELPEGPPASAVLSSGPPPKRRSASALSIGAATLVAVGLGAVLSSRSPAVPTRRATPARSAALPAAPSGADAGEHTLQVAPAQALGSHPVDAAVSAPDATVKLAAPNAKSVSRRARPADKRVAVEPAPEPPPAKPVNLVNEKVEAPRPSSMRAGGLDTDEF